MMRDRNIKSNIKTKKCIKNVTSKYILAQIDTTRSLADSTTSKMEDSIKNIRMTIVESNSTIENINCNAGARKYQF